MNWMDKLEKNWGRYAISDLHKYFIIAALLGSVLSYTEIGVGIISFLTFSVRDILRGQVWRLVSWVICPHGGRGIFMILFMLCLIPMGRHLERFLGTFRMNVYLIGGVLLSAFGGILVYIGTYFLLGVGFPVYLSTSYILLSIFMALALCMPDATVYFYFLFPIKMKWMLVVYLIELGYEVFTYFSISWMTGIVYGTQIIFALVNLFVFFYFAKPRLSRKQRQRQKVYQSAMRQEPRPGSQIYRHKCVICGRTELDDPNLTFRYCSKCTGNKEYCNEHLFTHEHR